MLTGYPCAGLSYRAKQLAELLETTQNQLLDALENDETNTTSKKDQKRFSFHIVPSHDPSHPRTVYDQARTEKEARAVAFARVKRFLAKDAFVILDGMNYIKGYRYQLWCEAKAMGTTCCVVSFDPCLSRSTTCSDTFGHRSTSEHQLINASQSIMHACVVNPLTETTSPKLPKQQTTSQSPTPKNPTRPTCTAT
jgi:protein KTI12